MGSVFEVCPPPLLFAGRSTFDVLYRLDRLPEEDTKVYARQFCVASGGPALNAAITHSLLGGKALLLSAVGSGPWAAQVAAEIARHSIQLLDLAAGTEYETPLTTVLASAEKASRTIVNPPLSTVTLPVLAASWQQAVPRPWGSVPPVVLSDGFHLSEVLPLLAACRNAGAMLCLDGGSWKPGAAELAPMLTAAICGERFSVPGVPETPDAVIEWFAAQGVPHIAITGGARPILGWDRGRRFEIEVERVAVVDTLGAGDVLHGAFCFYFAQNQEFESSLRRAAALATLACASIGAHAWAKQTGRQVSRASSAGS